MEKISPTLAERSHAKLSWRVKEIICAQCYVSVGIMNRTSSTRKTSGKQLFRKGAGDRMTHRSKRLYQLTLFQYGFIWVISRTTSSNDRLMTDKSKRLTNGNTPLQAPQVWNHYIKGKISVESNNNCNKISGCWGTQEWLGYLFSWDTTFQWEN